MSNNSNSTSTYTVNNTTTVLSNGQTITTVSYNTPSKKQNKSNKKGLKKDDYLLLDINANSISQPSFYAYNKTHLQYVHSIWYVRNSFNLYKDIEHFDNSRLF